MDAAEYGTTITTFDYVYRELNSIPDIHLVKFQEGFWWGHQDVYILSRGNRDGAELKAKLERAERGLAEQGQRRYAHLKAKLKRAVRRLANTREKERRQHQKLKAVHASVSWRITAPLRAIKRAFFR